MCADRLPDVTTASSGTILILGGSGFIGSRLTSVLLSKGLTVRIGDKKASAAHPDLWKECDVRNSESVRAIAEGSAAIINLAAEHRDNVRPLSLYHEVNVQGAAEVCKAAREAGVTKIVFTSSVAVYGFHSRPVDESGPFTPFNDYGKTKLAAEQVYLEWAKEDPARTLVIVRPTVVFGEGNRGNVYNLLNQIASGKFMMVGPGKNYKSMAYVGNIADFLAHSLSLGTGIHIYNYVDRPDMNMNALVALVRRSLNRPAGGFVRIPRPVAMTGGHMLDMVARITGRNLPISAVRVKKFCESTQFSADRIAETGFRPRYTLEDALARTIKSEFSQN